MSEYRQVRLFVILLVFILAIGSLGYYFLLNVPMVDAFYMTVITISTVGFGEVAKMGAAAKLFTVALIICGAGLIGYALSTVLGFIVEGRFKEVWRDKQVKDSAEKYENHVVVSGSGELMTNIIEQFEEQKKEYIIIEANREKFEEMLAKGLPVLQGDATDETALKKAHIDHASGFVAAFDDDAVNIVSVLTAKSLNEDLFIVARANEKSTPPKLEKVGADRVINANDIGGRQIAGQMLHPDTLSFFEILTHPENEEINIGEIVISPQAEFLHRTLKEAALQEKTGVLVIALKKAGDQKTRFNPGPEERLEKEDSLFVLGKQEQVEKLQQLAENK